MARYNVGDRARVCTPPSHKCKREERVLVGGKRKIVPCVDECCRSKYAKSASASTMDSAIDSRKVLSEEEFNGVVKDSKKVPGLLGSCIRFIASTGCRLRESLLVRARDVLFQPGKFSIVKIPTLKRGGRPVRSVHLGNRHWMALEVKSIVKGLKPNDFIFTVAARTLQREVEKILEKRKPDREGLVHIFRHTRASQLVKAGAPLNYVRQQLGWSSLEMAKIYAHTDEDEIAKVLEKIG